MCAYCICVNVCLYAYNVLIISFSLMCVCVCVCVHSSTAHENIMFCMGRLQFCLLTEKLDEGSQCNCVKVVISFLLTDCLLTHDLKAATTWEGIILLMPSHHTLTFLSQHNTSDFNYFTCIIYKVKCIFVFFVVHKTRSLKENWKTSLYSLVFCNHHNLNWLSMLGLVI